MTINEAVRRRILALCEKEKLPLNHFGTRCGLSPARINHVIRAGGSADMEFIQAVCRGFGLSVQTFFADPIFREL